MNFIQSQPLVIPSMINKLNPNSIQISIAVKCTKYSLDPILNIPLYTLQDSSGSILFLSEKELNHGSSFRIENGMVKMFSGFMVLVSKPFRVVEIEQVVAGGEENVSRTEYSRI